MISRLKPKDDSPYGAHSWPPDSGPHPGLFDRRKAFRKMVVMIDAELIDRDLPFRPVTKELILAELLKHPLVRVHRYADGGPPAGTSIRAAPDMLPADHAVYPGWVITGEHDPIYKMWPVRYESDGGGFGSSAVSGDAVDVARQDDRTTTYRHLLPSEAASQREADALAAQVASQGLLADLYITDRDYLHAATWDVARGVTICRVADALPLLGLYLRAQDVYPIMHAWTFNRWLFYWVGVRELLPEGWRWLAACAQHAESVSDNSLVLLGQSLLLRMVSTLEARDRIHLALNQPQDNDSRFEALAQLDVALVFLMGAFDVAARVAHRVLQVPGPEYRAGWQHTGKDRWLRRVALLEPTLASVVDPGSSGGATVEIVRLLRNSVHGATLQGLGVTNSTGPTETLVALPADDEATLVEHMKRTSSPEAWGVRTVLPDRVHIDPGIFIDRVLEHSIDTLNQLMALTPMERLGAVSLKPNDTRPPTEHRPGEGPTPFDDAARTSIRWQLGF